MSSPVGTARASRTYSTRSHPTSEPSRRSGMRPDVDLLPNWKQDVAAKLGWPAALLVGMLSVLVVRAGLFHYTGTAMISDTPDITTATEAGGAVVLSFITFLLFPYRGLKYVMTMLVGIGIATVAMHNAVHSEPGFFSLVFSSEWTEEVTQATKKHSIYVLGDTIPIELFGSEEEKKMPTVRRMN